MNSSPEWNGGKIVVNVTDRAEKKVVLESWTWLRKEKQAADRNAVTSDAPAPKKKVDLLAPLRRWLDRIEINNSRLAHLLCRLIPAHCPFERDVRFLGRTLFHIPPMCKLNPVYEQVVGLRFRALCYLADVCGEDVTRYC